MENENNPTAGVVRDLENASPEIVERHSELLGGKTGPKLNRLVILRPGIQVVKQPKRGCTEAEKTKYEADVKTYEQLVADGKSWDEIDKILGDDNAGKSKLIPKNVDYFYIHPSDCQDPVFAEVLKEKYADPDGKIRSLPVWFPINHWWQIIPHALKCYGQGGLRYISEERAVIGSGEQVTVNRVCTFPVAPEQGERLFGGRAWDERPCDPKHCAEYQSKECTLSGLIICCVPGVIGVGVVVIPTTSWYSLVGIKDTLKMVYKLTQGKIAMLFRDGKPIFQLRKVKDNISRYDTNRNQAIRQDQYLIQLDVKIDMMELALMGEQALERGIRAVNILTSGQRVREIPPAHEALPGVVENVATEGTGTPEGKAGTNGAKEEAGPSGKPQVEPVPRAKSAAEAEAPGKSSVPTDEKKQAQSGNPAGQTTGKPETGGNDGKILPEQLKAIKKLAEKAKIGIYAGSSVPGVDIEKACEGIAHATAAEWIKQLQANDPSMFLDLLISKIRELAGKVGVPAADIEKGCRGLTGKTALEWKIRLESGDHSMFVQTDDGDEEIF